MARTFDYHIGRNSVVSETRKAWLLEVPEDANEFAGYTFWTPMAGSEGGEITDNGGWKILKINFYCDDYTLTKRSQKTNKILDQVSVTKEGMRTILAGCKWDHKARKAAREQELAG